MSWLTLPTDKGHQNDTFVISLLQQQQGNKITSLIHFLVHHN